MSNEACTEASEVISSLPTLLGLEIVPKINIWPSKFSNMVPTADNISVYFFPEDYSAERVYDRLVDYIIENELAMISKVHDVELLVFSSRELHLSDWRYQRIYYLWGILRRKKKLLSRNQSDKHTSSQQAGSISFTWPSGSTAEIGAKDNGLIRALAFAGQ
ncbi:PHD finger-containing protein 1-like [Silene latifolia]|uniref:PHD finger-containing protein 1-like n=1 Tax=Silene latifolia TaxID=37657 RepID=UPI003D76F4B6